MNSASRKQLPLDVADGVPAGLRAHWCTWLGAGHDDVARLGAPAGEEDTAIQVIGSARRAEPGWDGAIYPLVGIVDPSGCAVLSVPPGRADDVRRAVEGTRSLVELRAVLPRLLGKPAGRVYQATYRWSVAPPEKTALPDVGRWVVATDERLPAWLRPFGGNALVVFDDGPPGRYLAGVGLKRHDAHVHEIAVGTDDAARGRGLARRLVAQAARKLLADGVIPTYLHDPNNVPSARVADAAGFPDRGWTALGLSQS